MSGDYQRAQAFATSGQYKEAWEILAQKLIDDPNDLRALVTSSYVMLKLGGLPQAYHFAKAATQLAPKDDACWTNLGHAASQMWLAEEAEQCYLTALECSRSEEHTKVLLLNLAALHVDNGRFEEAERVSRELLSRWPGYPKAIANLGFCQLANRNWAEGWANYHKTIGSDWRPKVQYRDEPEWDGAPGKTVALYEDQGLGDAISFAAVLPDAAKVCTKLIVECDPRLYSLFKRSFPSVKVYGTRGVQNPPQWDRSDWQIDASLPLGQLGEFFRTKNEDFTGQPYLTPCPDRVKQWKALFASKCKPVIGIAWTGGIPKTNARNRKLALEDLLPVLAHQAHFVSLQYKDARTDIEAFRAKYPEIDLVQYPWGTLTSDYDDTAALIASLDYVVCIQTAVAHTAGALGVPVSVFVPKATQWRYGEHGDSIPWYSSLKVVRQKEHGHWESEIERTAAEIRSHLGLVPTGTKRAPRANDLRSRLHRLRPLGLPGYRAPGDLPSTGLRLREPVQPGKAPSGAP